MEKKDCSDQRASFITGLSIIKYLTNGTISIMICACEEKAYILHAHVSFCAQYSFVFLVLDLKQRRGME